MKISEKAFNVTLLVLVFLFGACLVVGAILVINENEMLRTAGAYIVIFGMFAYFGLLLFTTFFEEK